MAQNSARQLGELAYIALLAEVGATPKPGLVDRLNNGAHSDMDHALFLKSALALLPYFIQFAALGQATAHIPPLEAFAQCLRPAGARAEAAMFAATGGVNTHKGAIFSMGLLLASGGRLCALGEAAAPEAVCRGAAAYVCGISKRELVKEPGCAATKGERAFARYGALGVRGEAEGAFPSVLTIGLPAYQKLLRAGASDNAALTGALLHLVAAVPDTNIITRLDLAAGAYAQQAAANCLTALKPFPPGSAPWLSRIAALDQDFIMRRVSPGGSADLLSCVWFLHHAYVSVCA